MPTTMDRKRDLATVTFQPLTESQVTEHVRKPGGSLISGPHLSDALGRALGPMLQVGRDGASAAMRNGKYLVEFSAEGNAALRNGSVTFLRRADGMLQPTLVSKSNAIRENATLVGRAMPRAAAAFSIAHVVVLLAVQGQLVSMERTLKRIEKKVDSIQIYLDDEQLARVRGRLRALRDLCEEMARSDWSRDEKLRWKLLLDAANTEFHQIEELAKSQSKKSMEAAKAAPMNAGWFGPAGDTLLQQFTVEVERGRQHQELRLMCILGRVAVAHLRTRLGAYTALDDLRSDIEDAFVASQDHATLVAERATAFTTKFGSEEYEFTSRQKLRERAQTFRWRVTEVTNSLLMQLTALDETQQQARVVVEIADGAVRRATVLA